MPKASVKLGTQSADLRAEMVTRFEKVDEKFKRIDERFARVDERFAKVDERFEDLTTIMIAGFDRIYDKIEAESRAVTDRITGLDSRIAELAKSRVTYDDRERDVTRLTKRIEHVEDIIARDKNE